MAHFYTAECCVNHHEYIIVLVGMAWHVKSDLHLMWSESWYLILCIAGRVG